MVTGLFSGDGNRGFFNGNGALRLVKKESHELHVRPMGPSEVRVKVALCPYLNTSVL